MSSKPVAMETHTSLYDSATQGKKYSRSKGEKYNVVRVQRPVGRGRSFKFFASSRKTYICGGGPFGSGALKVDVQSDINNVAPGQLMWDAYSASTGAPSTIYSDPQYNTTAVPAQYNGCPLAQLLFENEPKTFDDCKVQYAKHPDMFKYLTAVPVYYAIRMTIERAYIELDTSRSDATFTPSNSDIQFAQNLAAGQNFDFYFYWDSQNLNNLIDFGGTDAVASQRFENMLDNRKFKFARHRAGDGSKCSINGKMTLPHLIGTIANNKPYPQIANVTDAAGVTLSQFFGVNSTAEIGILNPPGALYFSPVLPFTSDVFKKLFNCPDNATSTVAPALARLCIDVNFTTKLVLNCSNYVGYMIPWNQGGVNKIPADIGT